MDPIIYVLMFVVAVLCIAVFYIYTQMTTITSSNTDQSTAITSLTAASTTTSSSLTAMAAQITSIQGMLAQRSNSTSLTSMNSTITPTFNSAGNVSAASCTSTYTTISDKMSEVLYVFTVTPIAESVATTITIPLNMGPLTSVAKCIFDSAVGTSDTNTEAVNQIVPVANLSNNTIQVTFTSNSTADHIVVVGSSLF